jgi:hypothetical protein
VVIESDGNCGSGIERERESVGKRKKGKKERGEFPLSLEGDMALGMSYCFG